MPKMSLLENEVPAALSEGLDFEVKGYEENTATGRTGSMRSAASQGFVATGHGKRRHLELPTY